MEVDIRDLVKILYDESWSKQTSYEKDLKLKGFKGKVIRICAEMCDIANTGYGNFEMILKPQILKTLNFRITKEPSFPYEDKIEEYYYERKLDFYATTESENIAKQCTKYVRAYVDIEGVIEDFKPFGYSSKFLKISIKSVKKVDNFWMTQQYLGFPSRDEGLDKAKENLRKEKQRREEDKRIEDSKNGFLAILILIAVVVLVIFLINRYVSCVDQMQ